MLITYCKSVYHAQKRPTFSSSTVRPRFRPFKIAKVIPIFKKDDSAKLDNYRPISILPTIYIVFEKSIFNHLQDHFITNKLFCDGQYGFRERHSTELAALELIDRIVLAMDKC